jgi:hypothetical protein
MRDGLIAFALLVLSTAHSEAQAVARNFEQLRFRLDAGDTVYVTDGAGREQQARVLEVSSAALAVTIDGGRRDLAERDVTQIRRRLPDPLWNGAVIGAATSAGLGIAAVASVLEGCSYSCWVIEVGLYGGMGALIGTGIDALVRGRKVIYATGDREASAQVVVRPMLLSGRNGLTVSVQF